MLFQQTILLIGLAISCWAQSDATVDRRRKSDRYNMVGGMFTMLMVNR